MSQDRFEMLAALCGSIEWAADPGLMYRRMMSAAAHGFGADSAHLHLLEFDGYSFMQCAAYYDSTVEQPDENTLVTMGIGRMADLVESSNILTLDYVHPHDQDVIPPQAKELGFKSGVCIPLDTPSGVVGVLTLGYARELPWSQDDHGFLLAMGRAVGMLVQLVQMSKKDLELQMLRERKRLSSEIHDTVSQMVSALAIRADIASACLDEGDAAGARSEIDAVAAQARQVTKVLHQEMLSLRDSIEGEGDIAADITGILQRFEEQWGCPARFDAQAAGALVVSEYTRLQMVRIVNESLQNVVRHARASSVEVTLRREGKFAALSIVDDGTGFDVEAVAPERLGIRIMRERAKSMGGSLSVISGDRGTEVLIKAPII